jgi:hypothetical protein
MLSLEIDMTCGADREGTGNENEPVVVNLGLTSIV